MDFLIAGTSATCASFFSNPFDVIKTRQQLQGELQKQNIKIDPYRTQWQAIKTIVKGEGLVGLQKGLVPAISFQFIMNSTRLGSYETVDQLGYTRFRGSDTQSSLLCVFWGGVCGTFGAFIACPLYMVKTQIQAQSCSQNAVGFQHQHSGMVNALITTYRNGGIRGCWRGYEAFVTRTAVGSAAQISTFKLSKEYLIEYETFRQSTFLTSLAASMISGLFLSIAMTPFDVVATRLFNQGLDKEGRGLMYRGILDCFYKTMKYEGFRGLYKGFVANYCRCAPHTMLNLTFWDLLKNARTVYLADENEMAYFE